MRRCALWALLIGCFLSGCGGTSAPSQERGEGGTEIQVLSPRVEPIEGEALSPNGLWEVRLEGVNEGVTASGLYPPETVQVVKLETGEACWEGMGFYGQAVRWSLEGDCVALAQTARTYVRVTIIHPESGSAWDVTLPDGGSIPEYVFLPEDWGQWLDDGTLRLTLGRGGDGEAQQTYRCSVLLEENQLTGSTLEQTAKVLAGKFDFDHDGFGESVEVVTVLDPEGRTAWYELHLRRADGTTLWSREDFSLSHAGEGAVFAYETGGRDYLLEFNPWMGQGNAAYSCRVFSLDETGREVTLRQQRAEFDVNFGSPLHQPMDYAAVADFLWEAKGLMAGSRVLLSTTGGRVLTDVPAASYEHSYSYGDLLALEDRAAMEAALRREVVEAEAVVAEKLTRLPGEYDFDHDGLPETVTLRANGETTEASTYWVLGLREAGEEVWTEGAALSHAGWNSLFALNVDGQDYLLRYHPDMNQGIAEYCYRIFFLSDAGEEVVLREGAIAFDVNFGSSTHRSFEPETIAAFLREVHGYLDESTLLLSTEGGWFHPLGSGADFREDSFCGEALFEGDLAENLRTYEEKARAVQGAEVLSAESDHFDGSETRRGSADGTGDLNVDRMTLELVGGVQFVWPASAAHAGWNSIFACEVDGRDYLLCCRPILSQGACGYSYQLFA